MHAKSHHGQGAWPTLLQIIEWCEQTGSKLPGREGAFAKLVTEARENISKAMGKQLEPITSMGSLAMSPWLGALEGALGHGSSYIHPSNDSNILTVTIIRLGIPN